MQIHNVIPSKLCMLSVFLDDGFKEFENIANYIREKNIRMSVRSIALKIKQYYAEVSSQLKTLRVICVVDRKNIIERFKITPVNHKLHFRDKKIVQICCDSERSFVKAYQSVLKESFSYSELKDMLVYQLHGITESFSQLKLLNSLMPSETFVSVAVY